MNFRKEYEKRIGEYSKLAEEYKKDYSRISILRLIIFLVTIAFSWNFYTKRSWISIYITIGVFIIVFVLLIIKHQIVLNKQSYCEKMVEINKKATCRANGKWTEFEDDGSEYKNEHHPYSEDLDVFGKKSLFQWLNITNTFFGRIAFKESFISPNRDINVIKERQKGIKEISDKLDFCQNLQCKGMLSENVKEEPTKILEYAESETIYLRKKWKICMAYIIPVITLSSCVLSIGFHIISVNVVLAFIILQMIINAFEFKKVISPLNSVYAYNRNIKVYLELIKLIENEEFENEYLKNLKGRLSSKGFSASCEIKKLERISNLINYRYNPFLYFVLNNILLWDLNCVIALERWKVKSGVSLGVWIKTIGEFEALSSLALICQVNPEWTFPEIINDKVSLEAKFLGHPLIVESKLVSNDVCLENSIAVVTGSNMSGKSTFLRTIGINLLLAYAGAPVCAKYFKCPVMNIFTSMRVVDDINSGVSMFYAELLRIKTIIENSKEDEPLFFLIDEIFRGTNSKDRISGAKNVLKHLSKDGIIGLVSTHDLELCELENDKSVNIKNYYFTEMYNENTIHFDYILREGISKTTNAAYLMKMVGIELID